MGELMDYQQAPPSYPPAAPPPPEKKGPPLWLMIGGGIVACVCLGCAAFAGFGAYIGQQEQKAYSDGHAAYLAGDCATTITKYNSLTGEDIMATAAPELTQCEHFQE